MQSAEVAWICYSGHYRGLVAPILANMQGLGQWTSRKSSLVEDENF